MSTFLAIFVGAVYVALILVDADLYRRCIDKMSCEEWNEWLQHSFRVRSFPGSGFYLLIKSLLK